VLAFAGLLALGSGLLFGLIPAIHGARKGLAGDLHSGGRSSTQGLRQQRYQRALVAVQVAVVVPLLAGAALLTSSFYHLQRVDPGFDAQGLLSARLTLSRSVYPEDENRGQFWNETLDRVASLPGVLAVGLGTGRPPDQFGSTNNFDLEDRPTPPGQSQPSVPWLSASPGYFEAMGIPLLAGRFLTDADQDSELPVVLVDQAWADRFFPGEDAVGRRFVDGGCTTCPWTTVVGVVGTVKYAGMEQEESGVVYQANWRGRSSPFLFVRAAGDPATLIPAIREELRQIDPGVPLTAIGMAETLIASSLAQPRHLMWLLSGFSVLALLLAVIGIYGIMAYSVQRRGRDIAIRLALGGTPGAVLRPIVGRGMLLVVVSLVAGIVLSLGVTRVLVNLLFEVSPSDPVTLVGVAMLLMIVALVACFVPAQRILRADPTTVLRQE
jgi:putative ABC transport system permease protein